MRHTTLATARLRFLFVAAKIWRHAGRVGVSYSNHYEEQGLFHRLMDRVRGIVLGGDCFLPVLKTALPDAAHVDDRPVHKILCGIAKYVWQHRLAIPNNQCRSSKGRRIRTNETSLTAVIHDCRLRCRLGQTGSVPVHYSADTP